jgi:hypothetical protein
MKKKFESIEKMETWMNQVRLDDIVSINESDCEVEYEKDWRWKE